MTSVTNITRRRAIHGAACVGALALPVGAAVAAVPVDADPGLAAIEAGYARWQELEAGKDALREQRNELWDRARADRPAATPEPDLDDFATHTAWLEADVAWRKALPDLKGHPAYEAGRALDAEADELREQAEELRKEVLAIPTTSPRGVLIKVALGMEARGLGEVETMLANPDDYGVHDGWVTEDLLGPLAADLRAMAGAS